MTAIRFYSHRRGPWAFLSNFYPSRFDLDGLVWPTVEAYFQSMKCPARAESVRLAGSPAEAKRLGRRLPLRDDWDDVRIDAMRSGLRAKFTQIPYLRGALLSSNDRPLIEAAPADYFWGAGVDGSGHNHLGMLLVELRAKLREPVA